jgi:hypothetical protein
MQVVAVQARSATGAIGRGGSREGESVGIVAAKITAAARAPAGADAKTENPEIPESPLSAPSSAAPSR